MSNFYFLKWFRRSQMLSHEVPFAMFSSWPLTLGHLQIHILEFSQHTKHMFAKKYNIDSTSSQTYQLPA